MLDCTDFTSLRHEACWLSAMALDGVAPVTRGRRVLKCHFCDKTCEGPSRLRTHERGTQHAHQFPIKCAGCGEELHRGQYFHETHDACVMTSALTDPDVDLRPANDEDDGITFFEDDQPLSHCMRLYDPAESQDNVSGTLIGISRTSKRVAKSQLRAKSTGALIELLALLAKS